MKRQAFFIWLSFFIFSFTIVSLLHAQSNPFDLKDKKGKWEIAADKLEYLKDENTYVGKGNVVIKRGDTEIKADTIRLNRKSMIAEGEGNVEIKVGKDILKGDRLYYDLKDETGVVYQGYVFFYKGNYHIFGETIRKTGPQSYAIHKGTFTTCDGPSPAWSFSATDCRVTVDGYAHATNATFNIKGLPILYSPYIVFPAKVTRQSGFLIPEVYYSDRDGAGVNIPFFWAIADNVDMTLYQQYMTERGYNQGMEFRYLHSSRSKIWIRANYMPDDQGADEEYQKGNISEPYDERYWIRSMANVYLPDDYTIKLNLDIVSDQDYLREFKYGVTGFKETNSVFEKEFGRQFREENNSIRESSLSLDKSWTRANLNMGFIYNDDLWAENNDATLQRYPQANLDIPKFEIWDPFYFSMNNQFINYYREEGERGQVLDIRPTLSMPINIKRYLSIEPSIQYIGTAYWMDDVEETITTTDGFIVTTASDGTIVTIPRVTTTTRTTSKDGTRSTYEARLKLSTTLERVFLINGSRLNKLQHTIRPEVIYSYRPDVDQDDLPSLVSRIDKKRLLTYRLINTFAGKFVTGRVNKDGKPIYTYRDVGRLVLSQSYDFEEADRDLEGPDDERRPFSDIRLEIEFDPIPEISFDGMTSWNVYDDEITYARAELRLKDGRGDRVDLDYSYRRDADEEITGALRLALTERLALLYSQKYSLSEDKSFETTAGFEYQHQCWGLKFLYVNEEQEDGNEQKFMVTIKLLGIGEMGLFR